MNENSLRMLQTTFRHGLDPDAWSSWVLVSEIETIVEPSCGNIFAMKMMLSAMYLETRQMSFKYCRASGDDRYLSSSARLHSRRNHASHEWLRTSGHVSSHSSPAIASCQAISALFLATLLHLIDITYLLADVAQANFETLAPFATAKRALRLR